MTITPMLAMQLIGFTTKVGAVTLKDSNPQLAKNLARLSTFIDAGTQTAGQIAKASASPNIEQTPQDPTPIPGIQENPGPKAPKGDINPKAPKGAPGPEVPKGIISGSQLIEGINRGNIGAFGNSGLNNLSIGGAFNSYNSNQASLFSDYYDSYASHTA